MPTDNIKPLTVPPFPTKLPDEFVQGLDERGKYLYQTLDKITQTQDWLTQRAVLDATTLAEVKEQTTKTNGRLLDVESKLVAVKNEQMAARPAIKTVNLSLKIVKSKWFWASLMVFFVFVLPWLTAHSGIVVTLLKLWLG